MQLELYSGFFPNGPRAAIRATVDSARVVEAFQRYMQAEAHAVSRAEFEENLALKLADERYTMDVSPLLAAGIAWDPREAGTLVHRELLRRLVGDPWRGEGNPWVPR